MKKSNKQDLPALPTPRIAASDLEPYVQASTKASGVPPKVEDAGAVAAFVTLVRSALKPAK